MTIMTLITLLATALSTPCEYEDSANCTWIAAEHGNGTGESYVDIDGVAYYFGE